ncbi:MAG: (deoxy)nucleoside triphosphate pyrophosphohydrolase [Acidobacteria bacterium]|nr:(deoxy)nucleoside triphosphate pyrophosphohydrolase [Acidobacteriota bacterium]
MTPTVVVAAAVVERDGAFLLTRRLEGTHLAGRWEFPGGKVEEGERLDECLRREMLEELGAHAIVGRAIFSTTHAYTERRVELHFFECEICGELHPTLGQEVRWVPRGELRSLDFPEADAELIDRLASGLPQAPADG